MTEISIVVEMDDIIIPECVYQHILCQDQYISVDRLG